MSSLWYRNTVSWSASDLPDNLIQLFISSLCSSQTVNQELLAAPLVPPQLTVKDFYMTGMFVYLFFYIYNSYFFSLKIMCKQICIIICAASFCLQTPSAGLPKQWRSASKPSQKEPPPSTSHLFAEHLIWRHLCLFPLKQHTSLNFVSWSRPQCLCILLNRFRRWEPALWNKSEKHTKYK